MVSGTRYFGGRALTARSTTSANSRFSATSGGPGLKSGISRLSRSTCPSRRLNSAGRYARSQFMVMLNATRRSQAANRAGFWSWSRLRYARINASCAMSCASAQFSTRLYARPYTCPW